MIQSLLEARAKNVQNFVVVFWGWEILVFCFRYLLTFTGVRANAYVPRDRETCPSQVLYTRWDEDLWKVFMRTFSAHVNESGKYVHISCLETDNQNLRLINGRFPPLSSHCFAKYMNIFHKTEVQTIILTCWTSLYLKIFNWFNWIQIFSSSFFQFF